MKCLISLILSAIILSGCGVSNVKMGAFESHVEWDNWNMSLEEKVWQTGHLVDVLQTETYHREDCYFEANPVTRRLIGREPSTAKVVAWGVGQSVAGHYYFQFVDNSNMPYWLKKAMTWGNVFVKYDTISNNHQIGVRIGKPATSQPNARGHCE